MFEHTFAFANRVLTRAAEALKKPDAPRQQPPAPPDKATRKFSIRRADGTTEVFEMPLVTVRIVRRDGAVEMREEPLAEVVKRCSPPGWY